MRAAPGETSVSNGIDACLARSQERRGFASFKKNLKQVLRTNADVSVDSWLAANKFADLDFSGEAGCRPPPHPVHSKELQPPVECAPKAELRRKPSTGAGPHPRAGCKLCSRKWAQHVLGMRTLPTCAHESG
jgi:hypothetical protein